MADGLDLSQLEALTSQLKMFAEADGEILEGCANKMAQLAIESAKKNTQAPTGRMKSGWDEDVHINKEGTNYVVLIRNNVEYAEYVDKGHFQEVGRFVPGLGDDHKGRRLVQPFVQGQHIAHRAELHCKRVAPQVVRIEVEKAMREKLEV